MAAQAGGQDQGADKNAYYILWMIGLIAAVALLIWYFFNEPLKQAFITIKLYELILVDACLQGLVKVTALWGMDNTLNGWLGTVKGELALAAQMTPDTISLETANFLGMRTGEYLRYPVAVYLVVLALVVFKKNVQIRLRKKYNMKSLSAQEQQNWPQIKIATKEDILNQDLDSGPWAMAMSPIQFAKKNKLVAIELSEAAQSSFAKVQAPEYKVTLDKMRAERAFSMQLGRSWQSIEAMAPHRRAIFAIFVARGCRDSKAAAKLIMQLGRTAAEGKLDCSGADEVWKKYAKNKAVQEICQRHAYEFTVFISLLQFAREDGVVASADYLWVKPLDRRLWYVINNVGRQTPGVEVGGIFAHWYYEAALKRPLSASRVEAAVTALELALSEIIYVPDEKEKEEILKRYQQAQAQNQENGAEGDYKGQEHV